VAVATPNSVAVVVIVVVVLSTTTAVIVARLREAGKEVRFLTNDPRPTRRQVCRRLAGMGVRVDAEEVITSGWATASYLLQNGVESAYVIGSRGLASEICGVGVEVVDRGPCEVVVVGSDEHVSYSHIRQASRYIFEGARFIATNADGSFPSPKGPLPGTGAILEAVRVTTNEKPVVVGKPFLPMYDMALRDLRTARERTVMIGDTLDSDLAGANRAGISGVLVSREHTQDTVDEDDGLVDAVIQDLNGLFDPEMTHSRKSVGERYVED
jgi:HAD superfamily hydrolase (TIGR01450 family)